MVQDRIVVGIHNSKLLEKLQLDPDLILASAITQVRQSEAVKLQQSVIRGKPDTPVGAVQRGKDGLRPTKGSRNSVDSSHKCGKDSCPRCGRYPALLRIRSLTVVTSMVISELSADLVQKFRE